MRCHPLLTLTTALLLLAEARRSFVDTAPVEIAQDEGEKERDPQTSDIDEVKQLEDLKHSIGKTFSVLKTQSSRYSDVNGQKEGHAETKEEVTKNGQLMGSLRQKVDSIHDSSSVTPATRVRTEVDIPSRGVHKVYDQEVTQNGQRRSDSINNNNVDKYNSYSGIQYSPLDMAEYVFWTGDEKGVTLAIEEFLQDGLMSREEAISFLQEIKFSLDFLQAHYAQQRLHSQEQQQAKDRATLIQKALGLDKSRPGHDPKTGLEMSRDVLLSKKSGAELPAISNKELSAMRLQQQGITDEDYEELMERLRVADFLYTEYSLEEVIYQLAKVMFSQSLTKGSAEAQEALQKFTTFLEAEAEQGHISRSLEKKVLDVLIASLSDTLAEHPHLMSTAREGVQSSPGNQLLHQLLLLNPSGVSGDPVPASSGIKSALNKQPSDDGATLAHQSTLAKGRASQLSAETLPAVDNKSSSKRT